jgi:hypothetical protein
MRIRNIIVPIAASMALLAGCATQTPGSEPTSTPTPEYNGVQDLDADAIWEAAADALAEAESFRIEGEGESEDGGGTVTIDAVYAGDLAQGSFSLAGLNLEFIITEDGGYIRAAEDFWRSFLPAEQANLLIPLLGNGYLKLPSSTAQNFIIKAEDIFPEASGLTKGEITEYRGEPAILITDDEGGELYVALVGEPYPLAIKSSNGNFDFLEFNEPVTIEAPADDQVVDATQYLG